MKAAIFAYSKKGCRTAVKVRTCLNTLANISDKKEFPADDDIVIYTLGKFIDTDMNGVRCIDMPKIQEHAATGTESADNSQNVGRSDNIPEGSSDEIYGRLFDSNDVLIFVGACGIAVRKIAPYIKDKQTDPAVICIDELGTYVIPILSGHIGRANAIARYIAEQISSTAVITTATDINGRFSVDSWAARNGFIIDDIKAAKEVSSAILEQDIPLISEFKIAGQPPAGIRSEDGNTVRSYNDNADRFRNDIGIYIGCNIRKPFSRTLRLIPKAVHLGIGCRKGTDEDSIRQAVDKVLSEHDIDKRAVKCISSIDIKSGEKGLLDYAEHNNLPINFYSAEELNNLDGDFTSSEFVKGITGVDNVCERAAMIGAEHLLVRKNAVNGVTIAAAIEHMEVHFG